MFKGSIRVGRLAGIPFGIHPLWFLIVGLITWSLGAFYFPERVDGIAPLGAYLLGLVSALMLFASIVLHELGHSLVARRQGVKIEEIDLWLLGGVARMRGGPQRPGEELRFALAGPAVTLLIAIAFGLIALALPAGSPRALTALVDYQLFINVAILVFNMLPAFPMDGGRVARALVWMRVGDLSRATHLAASVGRAFGYGFVALGLLMLLNGLVGGLWLNIVGLFVIVAAGAEERQTLLKSTLGSADVRALMSAPPDLLPGELPIEEALRSHFMALRHAAFPVVDRGSLVGILAIDRIEAMPAAERKTRFVRDLTDRDPDLIVDEHERLGDLLDRPAFQRVGRAVVVDDARRPVGLVSVTDISRAVRFARLLAAPSRGRSQDEPGKTEAPGSAAPPA